jgi:hypothetical protein
MEDNQARKPFPWAMAIIAAVVVILAALALFAYLKTARGIKNTVDKVITTAPEIARNFLTGNITHTFRESIPQITSTQGDVLELAVYRCDETFKRTDEKWAGWGWVYLGTTVAEIRVPVSFRYHLRARAEHDSHPGAKSRGRRPPPARSRGLPPIRRRFRPEVADARRAVAQRPLHLHCRVIP